jgi:hypothetical protein
LLARLAGYTPAHEFRALDSELRSLCFSRSRDLAMLSNAFAQKSADALMKTAEQCHLS